MGNRKHTPGPWAVGLNQSTQLKTNVYHCPPFGGGGFIEIAVCYKSHGDNGCNVPNEEATANAEFIVRACNAHADMAEALRDVEANLKHCDFDDDMCAKIRAALAKAGV